jgi:hypothetical protein
MHRTTLAKHVSARAEEMLQEICEIIAICKDHMESITFTTDVWTDPAMESFISLTAHWVDR